jgi:peptide/nickel transport system permease protein
VSVAEAGRKPLLGLRKRWEWRFDVVERGCLAVIGVLVIVVVFGPQLAPYNPNEVNLLAASEAPSAAHWLGTDDVGRDILSRILVGARTTLLSAGLIILIAVIAGTALALLSAWRGGIADRVLSAVTSLLFAFPALLLATLAAAVFGVGLTPAIVALSIAYTPWIARVVRGTALRERQLPYVQALTVLGAGGTRVLVRHMLPNIAALILAQATVTYGYAVMDLSAISFLGLGVQPPGSDWGVMVANGQQGIFQGTPYQALFAGLAIVITVLAVTLLGSRQVDKLAGSKGIDGFA